MISVFLFLLFLAFTNTKCHLFKSPFVSKLLSYGDVNKNVFYMVLTVVVEFVLFHRYILIVMAFLLRIACQS